MCIGCCCVWSTVSNGPSTALPSARRPPLPCGGKSAGPPSKKSGRRGTHDRLGRPIRLLLAAHGGAHLGTPTPHPHLAGAADPRPSGGHRGAHPGWAALLADPEAEVTPLLFAAGSPGVGP